MRLNISKGRGWVMGLAFALMNIVVMLHLARYHAGTQRERNLAVGLAALVQALALAFAIWGGG